MSLLNPNVGDLLSIYLDEKTVDTQKADKINSDERVRNVINGNLLWQVTRILDFKRLVELMSHGYHFSVGDHYRDFPSGANSYVEITLLYASELDPATKDLFKAVGYSGEPYKCHGYITSKNKYIPSYNKPLSPRLKLSAGMVKPNIFHQLGRFFKLDNLNCWSADKHRFGGRIPEPGETSEQNEFKQIIETLKGLWEDEHMSDFFDSFEDTEYSHLEKLTKVKGGTWEDFLKQAWEAGMIQGTYLAHYEPGDYVYDKVKEYAMKHAFKSSNTTPDDLYAMKHAFKSSNTTPDDLYAMSSNKELYDTFAEGGGRKKRRKRRKTKRKKSKRKSKRSNKKRKYKKK